MFQIFQNALLKQLSPKSTSMWNNSWRKFEVIESLSEYQIQYTKNLEMIKIKYKKGLVSIISLEKIIESIIFINKYYIFL